MLLTNVDNQKQYRAGRLDGTTLLLLPACHGSTLLISLMFFLCPVTDISTTVAPIALKFCMMVYRSQTGLLPFWGRRPRGFPNSKFLA